MDLSSTSKNVDLTVLLSPVSDICYQESDWLLRWVKSTEKSYVAITPTKIYLWTLFYTQVFHMKNADHSLPAEIFSVFLQICLEVVLKVNNVGVDFVDDLG